MPAEIQRGPEIRECFERRPHGYEYAVWGKVLRAMSEYGRITQPSGFKKYVIWCCRLCASRKGLVEGSSCVIEELPLV